VDPVSIIVSAVISGAAASLRGVASDVVKSAYGGLKALIVSKFGDMIDIGGVEKRPNHMGQQQLLEQDLRDAGAASEPDVLEAAKSVLEGVETLPPEAAQMIGVDLERVKLQLMEIGRITAEGGIGLRARDSEMDTIKIEEIQTGKK
jgi:hypothetical protein